VLCCKNGNTYCQKFTLLLSLVKFPDKQPVVVSNDTKLENRIWVHFYMPMRKSATITLGCQEPIKS